MKTIKIIPLVALIALAGCVVVPRDAPVDPQTQRARDADHAAIRQERAHQEYWEYERGSPPGGR